MDLEAGRWQAAGDNFSDRSSDASFVSAKFHSFDVDDERNNMFYDNNASMKDDRSTPLSSLAGILKTKEVFHLYNVGESFGSGKYGIIKLV